jgi:uncharacterized protein with HEPN domain
LKPSTSYLEHILVETEYLLKTSRSLSLNAFLADETLQRAFVRSLEIIGEAVKNLPDDLKTRYPDPDWRRTLGDACCRELIATANENSSLLGPA